jgi:hypothetical protein
MTTYRSTYHGNFRGIGTMLQRPGMARAVEKAAHRMQPIAERLSPTGEFPDDPHPGLYARSFRVEYGVKPVKFRGRPSERPYARLINKAPYALAVEHGNGRVPRYAVLRKTLDAAKAAHGGT